ncbi:hypothetical protein FSP39_011330 [Pinctada imbricata]|uniref:AVL9/DENND6 domain-containing protein n=1 Tax=Pinctada imbricata TaxID=66713 RepID=A0AA88YBA0_PINIB|nr:hypothetical protein FSP39_011330 [Pinctada imbricata]
MKTITQIESVQTGKVMTTIDSVVNIEEISDTMGILDSIDDLSDSEKDRSRFDRSLNLDDSTEVLKRSGSIEELDSPESILKIDQEDCFSWEEDRLLLKIDHKDDAESNTVKDKEGLGEVKEEIEGKDTVKPTLDLKLEISADDTKKDIISQPSEGDVDKNSQTNDSGISTASEVGPSENSSKESSPEKEITKSPGRRTAAIKNRLSSALSGLKSRRLGSKTPSSEQEVEMEVVLKGGQLKTDDCGFPLAIFTKGCVCHPYLSLQFFDLLQDINVRGFVIGATNMLFTQKKHLSDVIIEVSDQGRIEFHDRELQRQLNLTTADLRFADVLVKAVSDEDKDDIYLDGTEWEGGEEWLQVQFKAYLKSLLMTLTQNDTKLLEDFGTSFTQAFRTTHCYRHWSGEDHSGMTDVPTGHPFRGNLAVGDIRMRLQHNLQNTERGKKINAAVVQTGKYVEQAGKAVGGAITNARSAVTSWFSSFSQKSDQNQSS